MTTAPPLLMLKKLTKLRHEVTHVLITWMNDRPADLILKACYGESGQPTPNMPGLIDVNQHVISKEVMEEVGSGSASNATPNNSCKRHCVRKHNSMKENRVGGLERVSSNITPRVNTPLKLNKTKKFYINS